MDPVFTLISPSPDIVFPHGWVGWLGFVGLSAVILFLLWKFRTYNLPRTPHRLTFFFLLLALTLFTSLFIGIQMESGDASDGFLRLHRAVSTYGNVLFYLSLGNCRRFAGTTRCRCSCFCRRFLYEPLANSQHFYTAGIEPARDNFQLCSTPEIPYTSLPAIASSIGCCSSHGSYLPSNPLFCIDVYLRRQPGHPSGLFPAELDGDIDRSRNRVDDRWLAG